MLIQELDKRIADMKEVRALEEKSEAAKKQASADAAVTEIVGSISNTVISAEHCRNDISFTVSTEQKEAIDAVLKKMGAVVSTGQLTEVDAKTMRRNIAAIRSGILSDWKVFYHARTDQTVQLLKNVQEIAPDKNAVTYAVNKIKACEKWDFDSTSVTKMKKGLEEAESIIQNLGLTPEITEFLSKVSNGKATLADMTDTILDWIHKRNLAPKLSIKFV